MIVVAVLLFWILRSEDRQDLIASRYKVVVSIVLFSILFSFLAAHNVCDLYYNSFL